VRLEWPGRTWCPSKHARGHGPARVLFERAGEGAPSELVQGDALEIARSLSDDFAGRVDLAYIDPPFLSQTDYVHEARLDGRADGRVVRSLAYGDRWRGGRDGIGAYLDELAPRLEALARLLAPTGTLWVHVDYRASYLVRLLLDEILGRDAFKNEIVWRRAPNLGRQAASHQFGRTLDTIVVYGKPQARIVPPTRLERIDGRAARFDDEGRAFTSAPRGDYTDASIARLEKEGRVLRTRTGRVYIKYFLVKDGDGVWCRERRIDALWTDVSPLRHAPPSERTGFPTQKPRALLDRIVACASPPRGLVVDLFAGSGTTAEAAWALGRRFVVGDAAPVAIATARARLLRAGAPFVIAQCGDVCLPRASAPHVEVDRRGAVTRVVLRAPKEPAAWAIDVAYDESRGFDVAWHSERAPGARATPAMREATLPHARGPIAVRVWADDGSVATRVVGAP
jgi:DNA modification methylase